MVIAVIVIGVIVTIGIYIAYRVDEELRDFFSSFNWPRKGD